MKTAVIAGLVAIMVSSSVFAEEKELELDKDQQIRMACVEVIVGTNLMTSVSSNAIVWNSPASKHIREQVEWCAKFVKDGSMEYKR